MQNLSFFRQIRKQAAFTMIELLIVIAILGILVVAVLAAINPIEQINRGRDTGSRSDSEQLLSAIDRFYAYKGYYPWVTNPNDDAELNWRDVAMAWGDGGTPDPCFVLDKIANGDGSDCDGTNEVKRSFSDKITQPDYNHLFVYYNGDPGSSLYVCFRPQSGAMQEEAAARCDAGLPDDLMDANADVCADGVEYICLP